MEWVRSAGADHRLREVRRPDIKGSDAVARKLDELADGIVTPVTVKRALMARLHYLTGPTTAAGRPGTPDSR